MVENKSIRETDGFPYSAHFLNIVQFLNEHHFGMADINAVSRVDEVFYSVIARIFIANFFASSSQSM